MWESIYQLESEKFDLTEKMKRQKYEVRHLADKPHGPLKTKTVAKFSFCFLFVSDQGPPEQNSTRAEVVSQFCLSQILIPQHRSTRLAALRTL